MATAQNNKNESLQSAIQQQKAGADEIQTKIAKLLEANRQLAEAREIEDQLKTFKQNNPYSKTFMEHVRSIPKIKYLFVPTEKQKIFNNIKENYDSLEFIDKKLVEMGTKSSFLQGAIKDNILTGAFQLEEKLGNNIISETAANIKKESPNLKISQNEWKDIINNTYNKAVHYDTADDVNKLLFKNYGSERPKNLPRNFNAGSYAILSQNYNMTTKGFYEITYLISQNMTLREMQVKMNLLIKDNNNIPELLKLQHDLNIDEKKLTKPFGEHLKDTWKSIKGVFQDSKTQKLQKDARKNIKIIDGIDKDLDKALDNIEKSVKRRKDKLDKALYEIADRHNYDSKQRQEIGKLVNNLEPLIKELDKKFENAIDQVGKVIETTPPQLVTAKKEASLTPNLKAPTFPPLLIPTGTSTKEQPSAKESIYEEIDLYLVPKSLVTKEVTEESHKKEPIYQNVDPITKQQIIETITGGVSPEQKIAAKSHAPVAAVEVAAPPPAPPIEGLTGVGKQNVPPPPAEKAPLQPQDTGKSPQNDVKGDLLKQIKEAGNVKLKTKEERDELLKEQAKKIGGNIPKPPIEEHLKKELKKLRQFTGDNSRRNSTSSIKSSWGKD